MSDRGDMQSTICFKTVVLPGHHIDVSVPELPEGAKVEVIVRLLEKREPAFASALEFLESLPQGPRAFPTWEEYEKHLKDERNSWLR